MNILVVDDNVEMAHMFKAYLTKKGHTVATAGRINVALDFLKTKKWDMVFVDVVFPDISGISLLKTIKSRGDFIPIIMMSAYANREPAVTCLSLGAYDFIFKPFRMIMVEDIIKEIQDRKDRWIKAGLINAQGA